MALFPAVGAEVLFVCEDLWVPVVRLQGKICILPGIPRLFERVRCTFLLLEYTLIPLTACRIAPVEVYTASAVVVEAI